MSISRSFFAVFGILWIAKTFSRQVNVHIAAPWTREPYYILSEVSEFIYEYSVDAFWNYIDGLCDRSANIDELVHAKSDQTDELESIVFSIADSILPTQMQSLMEASVSLGLYAPSSEYQKSLNILDDRCDKGSYITFGINNDILCSNDSDIPMTEGLPPRFDDFVYPSPLTSKSFVYLYGIPGTTSFCSLHRKLQPLAAEGRIGYVVRYVYPSLLESPSNSTILQGYGVFLDIKNMEYKTIDDSKSSTAEDSSSTTFTFPDEDIQGINFQTLNSRRPDLQPSLRKLYDQLLVAEESIDEPMKVWKMKNIGLQTVFSVNELRNKVASDESLSEDIRSIEPIYQLSEYIHNFPSHASKISSIKMSLGFRESMNVLHDYGLVAALPPNTMFVNGVPINLGSATFNVYDLMALIRQEVESVSQLSTLQLPSAVASSILEAAMSASSSTSNDRKLIRIDVSKGAKYVVNFINNLERDGQYKRWSKRLQQLLVPSWSLIPLARNLYTVIAIVNVLSLEGSNMMVQMQMMYQQMIPVRLGYVLWCDDQETSLSPADICRFYLYVRDTGSLDKATNFLTSVASDVQEQLNPTSGYDDPYADPSAVVVDPSTLSLTESDVASIAYLQLHERHPKPSELSAFLQKLREYDASEFSKNCTIYITSHGLQMNSFSINGIYLQHQTSLGGLGQQVMQQLGREQYLLQQLVMGGSLSDPVTSIFNAILSVSTTYPRYHPILDDSSPIRYMDTTSTEAKALMKSIADEGLYIDHGDRDGAKGCETIWLSAPLNSAGLISAARMLEWLTSQKDRVFRMAFIWHLPTDPDEPSSSINVEGGISVEDLNNYNANDELADFLQQITSKVAASSTDESLNILAKVFEVVSESLRSDVPRDWRDHLSSLLSESPAQDILSSIKPSLNSPLNVDQIYQRSRWLSSVLDYSTVKVLNVIAVVFNARIAVLSSSFDKAIDASDIDLLVSLESDHLSSAVIEATRYEAVNPDNMLRIFSFAGRYGSGSVKGSAMKFHRGRKRKFSSSRRVNIPQIIRQRGMDIDAKSMDGSAVYPFLFKIIPSPSQTQGSDENAAPISIYYVFDPLSLAGQRAVALMPLLQQQLRLTQTLILTPSFDVHDFPLQNFYRFAIGGASTSFSRLPRQHVLTARVDAPEPWNIQTKIAQQDIDNLRCDPRSCGDSYSTMKDTTTIVYQLKNLLVAGQCYSPSPNGLVPPNGLQLILQHSSTAMATADTLVMQNLGYFQLQANPGLWTLSLAAGRASKIYSITLRDDEAESDASGLETMVDAVDISVRSFAGDVHQLFVRKRPGMEQVQLLDEDSDYTAEAIKEATQHDRKNMWQSLTSMFGSSGDPTKHDRAVSSSGNPDDHKIHIFSLATGHMYERLLRIMMLSVTKRTSMPVKFWLFENYLSPTFKTIAQAMSQVNGFEVAYVTYKWPEWLHPQTQQQRIIWGYKILFLDVLFPLHLKKIIYVDSDQVVRADLRELWEHDLQGKPYAYVPFCSSRQETLGFQFWRSGYWADHLRGKPYHISALYVVDLVRFRRLAVGDQLRATYDGLARDPNSLSNLDQDLPNYAQHAVPIHSLPQEWLWCETWCSDASKAKAKTIDLCNNPLHKEPKLDMARRVISGPLFNESWVELDDEIHRLASSLTLS